ncbi:MAG: twin-arginine translocase TatA/TatE family subunit [Nitrospinota bacterium]|nr:twin-arginine translocase TatA/TatE family subunit [Nitrospinota bacterium]
MMGIGFPELMIILVIIMIIFGAGKLPEIGSAFGNSIKNFKKSMNEAEAITDEASDVEKVADEASDVEKTALETDTNSDQHAQDSESTSTTEPEKEKV